MQQLEISDSAKQSAPDVKPFDKPLSEVCEKPVFEAVKRIYDIVLSTLALIFLSPVLLIIIIAITIDDPGNPFFVQERIGKNSKSFKIYKFRSMCVDAEKQLENLTEYNECKEGHFKIEDDPRVTRVGKLLRKTSLDELPQLINIIKGDMSIVGPRPFIPQEQRLLPDDRLCVKPGLSCYWQITDTTNMSGEEQLELDYKYIRERSVLTDFKIIVTTLAFVFRKKNK